MSEAEVISLSELQVGDRAEIVSVEAAGSIRKRLLEMGVRKGVTLEVERVAPLGDPVEVKLMGYHLSLRRAEGSGIKVKRL